MPAWKGIIGRGFRAAEFKDYVSTLRFTDWRPQFAVVHNTSAPRLSQWHSHPGAVRMRNLESYYRDEQRWSAGPHLFIADDLIWVFTPLTTSGVHSPSWNGVSWGIELVGEYDEEPFNAGVRENAVDALAALLSWRGLDPETLRFHKEDPGTTHTHCPGRNVNKADLIARIKARMAGDNHGEHAPHDNYLDIGERSTGAGASEGAYMLRSSLLSADPVIRQIAAVDLVLLPPATSRRVDGIATIQRALNRLAEAAGMGAKIDFGAGDKHLGFYGPQTIKAIKAFQRLAEVEEDGSIGDDTLQALDGRLATLEASGQSPTTGAAPAIVQPPSNNGGGTGKVSGLDVIVQIAAQSSIARYDWNDRGVAPLGYTKGMALVYARLYCRLTSAQPDEFVLAMAQKSTGNANRDALEWYAVEYQAAGMDNSQSGVPTLRHLFVMMMGLGMMESSGKYCEGLYKPDGNTTADTAEAGLFQTSYNARSRNKKQMEALFDSYQKNPTSVFLSIFKERKPGQVVSCSSDDAINYGQGAGRTYQKLTKEIPEFAAEFTAIALRSMAGGGPGKGHWGPINKRQVEIVAACDEMFQAVEKAVDEQKLCSAFA